MVLAKRPLYSLQMNTPVEFIQNSTVHLVLTAYCILMPTRTVELSQASAIDKSIIVLTTLPSTRDTARKVVNMSHTI